MKNKTYIFTELWERFPKHLRDAMDNCEQDSIYHPEGTAGVHTRLVFEFAIKHFDGDVDLLLSALFHDLGKPETQRIREKDGRTKISNIGHERKCEFYIEKYFDLFADVSTNKEKVLEICDNHMRAHLYVDKSLSKPAKRKTFEDLKYFEDIIKFSKCDEGGR